MRTQKSTNDKSVTIFLIIVFIVICLAIFLFLQTQGGLYSPFPYRYLAPYTGKVIDADTGEPIAGVVVLCVYYLTRASVAGQTSYIVDGQETMTDEKGEFHLPEQKKWFRLERGYPEGTLIIFKPGYGIFPWHARAEAIGVNSPLPPPGKYIFYRIPKLTSEIERKRNLPSAYRFDEIPYQKQKMYIDAINLEAKSVGLKPYPLPEKESNHVSKTISGIINTK